NEHELAETDAALRHVCARLKLLEERRTLLERIRRTAPRLEALRELEAELATLAGTPSLPDDARERFEEARRTLDVARARLDREEAAAAEARRELAALDIPEALLAANDDVQRLYERRGAVLDARDTLRDLLARRGALHAELRKMYDGLGLAPAAREEPAAPPCDMALAELRQLIGEDADLCKRLLDIGERRAKAAAEVAAAEAELQAMAVPPDLTRLELAVAQAQCAGGLETEVTEAEQAAAEADARLTRTLAGLRLWRGDGVALAALPAPERETILRFEREMGEAQTVIVRGRDALAAAREEEARCARDLAALGDAAALPTVEALATARARRDQGWNLIRRLFIDGERIEAREIEAFAPRPRLAERFERTIRDADALADRRQGEAERIARHDQLVAYRDAATARRAECEARAIRCEQDLAALRQDWCALWQVIGIQAETPREMDRWLSRREDALRAHDQARAAARRLGELRDRLVRERRELSAALGFADAQPSATAPFAALLEEARFRLDAGRGAERTLVALRQKCKSQIAAVQGEAARLDALAEQRTIWAAAWSEALQNVSLPHSTSPAAAATALALWGDIRRTLADIGDVDSRICRIENDAATFSAEVSRLLARARPELVSAEPAAAMRSAFERLQLARRDAQRRQDLQARIGFAAEAARTATAAASDARAVLDGLLALTGRAHEEELPVVIGRSRRQAMLLARADALRREILADAEGRSLAEVADEAEIMDPDRRQSELAALTRESDALFAETERLGACKQALVQSREQMATAQSAAEAEQARRNALADLEDVSERWLVLKTAAFLLRRGVEQFRREQQGPLLARAESLFRALTLGSFVRFRIDYDDADRPCLLGVRSDG
ncbi:MAG: hypothetical protein ACXW25_07860, partial [Rhodospirillales bacterium]